MIKANYNINENSSYIKLNIEFSSEIDLGTIEYKFAAKHKYFNGSVSSNVKQTKHGSVSEDIILKCVCDSDTY